jgi:hypothetical protein
MLDPECRLCACKGDLVQPIDYLSVLQADHDLHSELSFILHVLMVIHT